MTGQSGSKGEHGNHQFAKEIPTITQVLRRFVPMID